MVLHYSLGARGFAEDLLRTLRSMLRLTERDFRRALRLRSAVAKSPYQNEPWMHDRIRGRPA